MPSKDSADYFRFIMPPDTNVDKDLFRVYDFYMSGKPKMVATSLTKSIAPVFDGTVVSYFPDGKRKATMAFVKGLPKGYLTSYYPNGEQYATLKFDPDIPYNYYYNLQSKYLGDNGLNISLIECRDSTGKIMAVDGTGHIVIYNDDFTKIEQEGNIVKNKKDGDWTGLLADTGKYVITFHKGDMKYGVSYLKSGKQYKFKEIVTKPVFSDGMPNFYLFIKQNTVYLESARQRKIEGVVNVDFYVETDGTLSNFKIEGIGLTESLNEEALRVIKMSPLWNCGTVFGIPTRMPFSATVRFYPY